LVGTWSYNAGTNAVTVTGGTSGAPCTFADWYAADVAGGWGKITRQGTDSTCYQYACGCRLIIGDGATSTYFTDLRHQIIITNGALGGNDRYFIERKAASTLTLGILIDATTKTVANGVIIHNTDQSHLGTRIIYGEAYLYGCEFQATADEYTRVELTGGALYYCIFMRRVYLAYAGTLDVVGCLFSSQGTYMTRINTNNALIEGVTCLNTASIANVQYFTNFTFKNLVVKQITDVILLFAGINRSGYFINCTIPTWTFTFSSAGQTIYRQYEFDLTTDTNAVVTLKDNTGTVVFTETPASGTITTQTVSRGFYNQANGNTLQDYGPHTLTISKQGKQTYTDTLTLTEKTKLDITLLNQPNPLLGAKTRTVTKRVMAEDPVTEPALMAVTILLINNRQLKKKVKEYSYRNAPNS
jgi:hypothetical protein